MLLRVSTFGFASIAILASVFLLTACASQPSGTSPEWSAERAATEADTCREMLAASGRRVDSELDSSDIHLFNWNIQKARRGGSLDDLSFLANDKDLVLIQEAALRGELLEPPRKARFWSFAPGFRRGDKRTGVMTMSASEPLTHCSLTAREPWLRTPKATGVTQYALSGTDQTLVVVNIHAVNFTFGVRHFQDQLAEISAVLPDHDGPVILSGDFNTWRKKRFELVRDLGEKLGLKAVRFEHDERKLALGLALDHIYVRGLTEKEASTRAVSTSDHNPMMVRLSHHPETSNVPAE